MGISCAVPERMSGRVKHSHHAGGRSGLAVRTNDRKVGWSLYKMNTMRMLVRCRHPFPENVFGLAEREARELVRITI